MKLNELREVVGRVTISFAVNPETKYLLQLGAKKAGVTFSEYCRQVIEGNLPIKEEKEESKQTTEKPKENVIYCSYKQEFIDKMRSIGYQKNPESLVIKDGHPQVLQIGKGKEAKVTRLQRSEWMIEY